MKTIHRIFIKPPIILRHNVEVRESLSIPEICAHARFPYRVSGGNYPRVYLHQAPNSIGWTSSGDKIYLVDAREINLSTEMGWEMILETLAYGFMDYAARESIRHT